jgi:hypothetical protein
LHAIAQSEHAWTARRGPRRSTCSAPESAARRLCGRSQKTRPQRLVAVGPRSTSLALAMRRDHKQEPTLARRPGRRRWSQGAAECAHFDESRHRSPASGLRRALAIELRQLC